MILHLVGCMALSSRDAAPPPSEAETVAVAQDEPAPAPQKEAKMGRRGYAREEAEAAGGAAAPGAPAFGSEQPVDGFATLDKDEAASPEQSQARAWFPESFLWRPIVEIPESGSATVDVPVPDTLTTWRVLALGQTRTGAQAGAVTQFSSTLPAYVDVVAPESLWVGDRVALPIQAVSQQGDPLNEALSVTVGGVGAGGGRVALPPYGAWSDTVSVSADRAGELRLVARLGEVDAVEKVIPVRPVGRPVTQSRGGTLAGPRSFSLGAAPGSTGGDLVITAFPGALGVARAELEAAPLRGGTLADAAYTFAITGFASPLVAEGAVAADTLRATQLRAWQTLARATRTPGAADAAVALVGLRLASADSLAGRLAIRLADSLRAEQAADGMWTLPSGTPLDVTLVHTARVVWALGADNEANRLRASGAFERHRVRLASPYVAAWALAAGVLDDARAEEARGTLRAALHAGADGAKTLRVDARRADGSAVSEAEATAVAILALPADDPARPDLAAGLLGLYDPGRGFGDGATGLVALRALSDVFSGEIPREVAIRVTVDGVEVGRAVLNPAQPHAPVRVVAPGLRGAGEHAVSVVSEPAVPGLAFTAVARDHVPWTQSPAAGLDLSVARPALVAGQRAELQVAVAGPADRTFDASIGLAAGVEPDAVALDALVSAGRLTSWRAASGRVDLRGLRTEGGVWRGVLPVTPTLAGDLLADASRVWPAGDPTQAFERVPERWVIR
jgi:hypothetical protein